MNTKLSVLTMALFLNNLFGCTGNKKSEPETKADIFPTEKFAVIQAKFKGKPIIGSINQAYSHYNKKEESPWCLVISIGLNLDSLYSNGLPLPSESEIANSEEDELVKIIKQKTTAHYIGHVFNDTFLDVYLYLDDPKAVNAFLQTQVNKKGLKRGFGFTIENDPNWAKVKPFMKE